MDDYRSKGAEPGGPSPSKINSLMAVASQKAGGPKQQTLGLSIAHQVEKDGLEMGVLSDGTPFLTGRALALLCGVHSSVIYDLTADWAEEQPKARIASIKNILASRGIELDRPYVTSWQKGNATFFAYPDYACLAILEHYAFESTGKTREIAVKNYRSLAGHTLREFIYNQVGYDPSKHIPAEWRQFHDRVSLVYNSVPPGYFGIFKEIAEMIVTLGQAGVHINESFVPDISVGIHWSNHWTEQEYDNHFAPRIKFEHNYPSYFPQAQSNPQPSWCYPEAALGEFRRWFRENYIGGGKFEQYIMNQVKKKALPPSTAQSAIAAYGGSE